jgi:hypothetical protein
MTQPIHYPGDIRQMMSKIRCQTENFSFRSLTLFMNAAESMDHLGLTGALSHIIGTRRILRYAPRLTLKFTRCSTYNTRAVYGLCCATYRMIAIIFSFLVPMVILRT